MDWEKAFDKVDHGTLLDALRRLDIHEHVIKALEDGYQKATFFTKDEFGQSGKKTQSSGIRQGCPLSPYLFVIVMTCINADVQARISNKVIENRIPGADFDLVYYADDTIVISRTKEACEELLELVEEISASYGLKLNKDKCVNLNMNTEEQQSFKE